MKKILLLTISILLLNLLSFAQSVKISNTKFTIDHGDIVLYLDNDTNTYVSVHTISVDNIKRLDSDRDDKWHKEIPFGPYKREYYVHSGYDLGHLTPAHITSYDNNLQYHSFSFFNQAPQLSEFNRGKWKSLESKVVREVSRSKSNTVIVTGVLYENYNKKYLSNSRIKIPFVYYKILVTKYSTQAWIGSNINGLVTETYLDNILMIAKENGNNINIEISH